MTDFSLVDEPKISVHGQYERAGMMEELSMLLKQDSSNVELMTKEIRISRLTAETNQQFGQCQKQSLQEHPGKPAVCGQCPAGG